MNIANACTHAHMYGRNNASIELDIEVLSTVSLVIIVDYIMTKTRDFVAQCKLCSKMHWYLGIYSNVHWVTPTGENICVAKVQIEIACDILPDIMEEPIYPISF